MVVAGGGGGQLQPGRLITEDVSITAINKRILQVAGVTGPALDSFGAGVTPYANL